MKYKNTIILFLISVFLLSFSFSFSLKAQDYSSAQKLADSGIIVDNFSTPELYRLNHSITRGEMSKVMLEIAGVGSGEKCVGKFKDISINTPNDWVCFYVEKGLSLGYLSKNDLFRPEDSITKSETLKMLLEAVDLRPEYSLDNWQQKYHDLALEKELIDGFSDFNSIATRGFVFDIGASVLEYRENKKSSPELFSVNFTDSMNKASVEENLRIHPALSYSTNWIDDKSLEIKIDDILENQTRLLVNILDDAIKANGEKISNTLSYEFEINSSPEVAFVSPKGLVSNRNQNITVRFSGPVVSLTNFDNMRDCPIEITPKLEGECVWLTTSTFQFKPNINLPLGARYNVRIPKSFKTNFGINLKDNYNFSFDTPDFKLISYPKNINLDESVDFVFNDDVKLSDFEKHFTLSGINNSELLFSYFKKESNIKGEYNTFKNIIQVQKKSGDFGYSNTYDFSIDDALTSYNGNLGIAGDLKGTFATNDFLLSSKPFVLNETNNENKYNSNNLIFSNDESIIIKNNPYILLEFYKEVGLDKSLFDLSNDFELFYLKEYDYNSSELKTNNKKVILKVLGDVKDKLSLKINTSKISSSEDIVLDFKTKKPNTILNFKNIDYRISCIEFDQEINTSRDNLANFEFDNYSNISFISKLGRHSRNDECEFEEGKNKYILYKEINPDTQYNLLVNKNLLSDNNYGLDKNYSFSFKTPKAKNEDKFVRINTYGSNNNLIISPSIIKDQTISIESVNVSRVLVEVCVGGFDIKADNFINNKKCNKKEIEINNLGFKPNLSVISLKSIFGDDFNSDLISVSVSKIKSDQTEFDSRNDNKILYLISDIKASIKSGQNNILWLYDYNSGEYKTDFIDKISLYKREYDYNTRKQKVTYTKDISFKNLKDGLYELQNLDNSNILLISLKDGSEVFLDLGYYYSYREDSIKTYLYTDKPLYKPGETVNIKGVSRIIKPTEILINNKSQNLSISNPRYSSLVNESVSLSNKGSFEYSFEIPKDAILGDYRVSAGNSTISFSVEEYKTPSFKISQNTEKDTFLRDESVGVNITGEFYSQIPLSFGEGRYTLTSSDFYFDGGKTTGYHFGPERNFWWPIYDENTNNKVQSGEFILDNNGEYNLNLDISAQEKDKIYTLSTTLVDPNSKESISNNITFKGINSSKFLGIKFDNFFYTIGDKANIGMVSVDKNGAKLANKNLLFEVNKIEYKRDSITNSYNEEKETLVSKNLKTNSNGEVEYEYEFKKAGQYEFVISSPDRAYKTTRSIFISGGGVLNPAFQNNNINLLSNKDIYDIGDKADIIINSPEKNIKGLLTIERLGKIIDYKVIDIKDYTHIEKIDIKKEYLPNFDVKVLLIKDINAGKESLNELRDLRVKMLKLERELLEESQDVIIPFLLRDRVGSNLSELSPEMTQLSKLRQKELELLNDILPQKYTGEIELKVSYDTKKLDAKISLDKDFYNPGDKQIIELKVLDSNNNPVNGELTLSIIDESLLALKKNNTSIIDYFYSNSPNNTRLISSMDNILKRIDFIDEYLENGDLSLEKESMPGVGGIFGVGNFVTESMSDDFSFTTRSSDLSIEDSFSSDIVIRSDFRDLAYYTGKVEVINGKALIEVYRLPDNVTSWEIMGFVHTTDTKLGEFSKTFNTNLELSITPRIPDFFVSGDIVSLGMQVFNNTSEEREVILEIKSGKLEIKNKTKTINVKPNSSSIAYFEVLIPTVLEDIKNTKITFTARDDKYSDGAVLDRIIKPSSTSEYIFTNGFTDNTSHKEILSLGEEVRQNGYFEVGLGASILTNLFGQIDREFSYPTDNMYSRISFLENYKYYKNIFEITGKTQDFKNIKLADFNGDSVGIEEVYKMIIDELPSFIESDLFRVTKECFTNNCKNLNITKRFLSLDLDVSNIDTNKIYESYKNELKRELDRDNLNRFDYFIPSLVFGDFEFIDTNFAGVNTDNTQELVKYMYYNLVYGRGVENIDEYISKLKNNVLIEARGSFLSDRFNLLISTNYFIGVLSLTKNNEQLLLDNLLRYSLSHLGDNNFRSNSFISLLKAIGVYIENNLDLKTDFESEFGINSKVLMKESFNKDNLFERISERFDFSYIDKTGDNEFGFGKTGEGRLYYDFGVKYFIEANDIKSRENGIVVSRNYYDFDEYNEAFTKKCYNFFRWMGSYCERVKTKNISPINTASLGDKVVGEIQVILDRPRKDVVVNDFLPSGARLINTNFDTTSGDESDVIGSSGRGFDFVENRQDRVFMYSSYMPAGVYTYTYVFDVINLGEFSVLPAVGESLETPEIWGRSNGGVFEVR